MSGSDKILALLAERHSKDVFVPECKDGPTHYGQHRRMDAWVMPRSWSKPWVTAYEIKWSRSDFLRDDKWPRYLECCHQLYFAAPRKLIDPSELPAEVGLVEMASTGTRLLIKKKAPLRTEQVIPEDVWRYVLMCRATIGPESEDQSSADRWRAWLKRKRENHELGWEVRGRIREEHDELRSEAMQLRAQMKGYDRFREALRDAGIDPDTVFESWTIKQRIEEIVGTGLLDHVDREAGRCMGELELLRKKIAHVHGKTDD